MGENTMTDSDLKEPAQPTAQNPSGKGEQPASPPQQPVKAEPPAPEEPSGGAPAGGPVDPYGAPEFGPETSYALDAPIPLEAQIPPEAMMPRDALLDHPVQDAAPVRPQPARMQADLALPNPAQSSYNPSAQSHPSTQPAAPVRTYGFATGPQHTPFHQSIEDDCADGIWDRWNGAAAVRVCSSAQAEAAILAHGAGMADLTALHALHIHGPDAGRLVDRVTTIATERMSGDTVRPALLCRADGRVMAVADVVRWHGDEYSMITEASVQPWLEDAAVGLDAFITDLASERAALGLFGASVDSILRRAGLAPDGPILMGAAWSAARHGVGVRVIRHGGAGGPFGFARRAELWVDPRDAAGLWTLLAREAGAAVAPVGLGALEAARIEAGWPRIGVDSPGAESAVMPTMGLDPVDLGLEEWVDMEKPAFSGRGAIDQRLADRRQRILHASLPGPVRVGDSLYCDGEEIARFTSVALTPVSGLWSGLAVSRQPVSPAGSWSLRGGDGVQVRPAGLAAVR